MITVVTGIIQNKDKFLIVKRKEKESIHGGLWVFPGGKVEENEDIFTALKREIKEEVGLDISNERKQISEYEYERPDGEITVGVCFLVKTSNDKITLSDELEDFAWVNKEEFKKYTLPFEGVVVDECDYFLSPLFTKGRSAMATALYNWIRLHPTAPVLLMSATIIKNAPHSSHTALTYIQRAISWKAYRALQYNLVSRPYNPRPFYEPKKGWQKVSAKMITANASIVDMSDIVTVPEQFEQVVRLYRV